MRFCEIPYYVARCSIMRMLIQNCLKGLSRFPLDIPHYSKAIVPPSASGSLSRLGLICGFVALQYRSTIVMKSLTESGRSNHD